MSAGADSEQAVPQEIGLIHMIAFVSQLEEDIDIWERMLHQEGEALYSGMAARRIYFRKIRKTLELVYAHQTEIVALVKARQEAQQRRAAARSPSALPARSSQA